MRTNTLEAPVGHVYINLSPIVSLVEKQNARFPSFSLHEADLTTHYFDFTAINLCGRTTVAPKAIERGRCAGDFVDAAQLLFSLTNDL